MARTKYITYSMSEWMADLYCYNNLTDEVEKLTLRSNDPITPNMPMSKLGIADELTVISIENIKQNKITYQMTEKQFAEKGEIINYEKMPQKSDGSK